jgi:hypothetical protein
VIFHEFLRNLAECTAIGGYFIGTCYDGKTVFKRLQTKIKGEGIAIMKRGRKIYEILKMYDETGFPDDETSLSYMIHVYQDSINKTFPEYLVNFDYLVRMLSNYGFTLVKKEEALPLGLPNGTGLFSELFSEMEEEIAQDPRKTHDYKKSMQMSEDEKWISFMNRYFVFKKTHRVDAERIYKQFVSKKMLSDLEKDAEEMEEVLELAKETAKQPEKKTRIRKLTNKLVIDKYSPVADSAEPISPKEIQDISKTIAAITADEPRKLLEEETKKAEQVVPETTQIPAAPTKSKLVIGAPTTIKVTKPKLKIGEPITIKIKKPTKK